MGQLPLIFPGFIIPTVMKRSDQLRVEYNSDNVIANSIKGRLFVIFIEKNRSTTRTYSCISFVMSFFIRNIIMRQLISTFSAAAMFFSFFRFRGYSLLFLSEVVLLEFFFFSFSKEYLLQFIRFYNRCEYHLNALAVKLKTRGGQKKIYCPRWKYA